MNIVKFAASAALIVLAGCSSTKLPETSPPAAASTAPAPATAAAPATGTTAPAPTSAPPQPTPAPVRSAALHPLDDPQSALARRTVYFEFDSAALRDADRPLVEAHARYLASSRTARMRVEGHCDERGGREYNLALGQRRAEVVVKTLQLMGARGPDLEATSFGEERPADTGHDEAAWVKNRRAELTYLSR
jgi:peptidoglycan-associated lipoprotein